MEELPPIDLNPYDTRKVGFFGKLGRGQNVEICFLQTGLRHDELERIVLVENIPGSEQWEVRDLFQRDVDHERVTGKLLPYLQDETRVKYFNPLTLALLPMDSNRQAIRRELLVAESDEFKEGSYEYVSHDFPDHFRFEQCVTQPAFSRVRWSSSKVKVVAIDGQHRLSALKRWKADRATAEKLNDWMIPVVVLGIFRASKAADAASLLDVVRRTFVYINTQAVEVNDARKILLNDESTNDICVQEIVQNSHTNDCLPLGERVDSKLPLLFFDWRGETHDGIDRVSPAAIVKTVELKNWLEGYLMGRDGDEQQAVCLGIDDMVPRLESWGRGQLLTHSDAQRVHKQFAETLYRGLANLLENFAPYRQYIAELRGLEREESRRSDTVGHAFTELRFGTSGAPEDQISAVKEAYDGLLGDIDRLKHKIFPELLTRDIGPRGIMSAFSMLKELYDHFLRETSDWFSYSQWFLGGLNEVYEDGWFDGYDDLDPEKRRFLTHLAFDPSGGIVNYKVSDAKDGLGTLLALLVISKQEALGDYIDEGWERWSDNFLKLLRRGFKKQVRADEEASFEGTNAEFKRRVNDLAEERTEERLKELSALLNVSR